MKVFPFCKTCFNNFENISSCQRNAAKPPFLPSLKIICYLALAIFLSFVVIYATVALFNRVNKKQIPSNCDKAVEDQAKLKLIEVIQTSDSKLVHSYTGDLISSQKSTINASFTDKNTLQIYFNHVPDLRFTIRKEDIFQSRAQIIVNAANHHLNGGGGIDGAIHAKGGAKYQTAHHALKKLYSSNYISGHAALIDSGSLKEQAIDYVIVVAGPQGEATLQKENELYSCYYNSLLLTENQNKTSIAFPSISTGIFGFSKERAACISLKAIYDFTQNYPDTKIKHISIHFFNTDSSLDLENYKKSCD